MTSETEVNHDGVRVRRWDAIGVVVSAACIAHCIAMPLLLGLLPALGLEFLARDGVHELLAVVVLVVAVLAFVPGYRTHRDRRVILLGGIGVVLLGGAAFFPGLSVLVESVMTAFGGALLVAAHLLNRRASLHAH